MPLGLSEESIQHQRELVKRLISKRKEQLATKYVRKPYKF